MQKLLQVVDAAAKGDLTLDAPALGSDAIGRLANGVEVLLHGLRDNLRAVATQAGSLNQAASALRTVAGDLTVAARAADDACEATDGHTHTADERMAAVVEVVDQVDASNRALADRVGKTREVTGDAFEQVSTGRRRADDLADAAVEIGSVVGTIRRIAAQTKLLALNASIEAARAGEAGKGFGVVATEVKSLAREVEDATRGIAQRIQVIRDHSSSVADTLAGVEGIVGDLDALMGAVVDSTTEQAEMTGRILFATTDASEATQNVVETVRGLREQTSKTADAASETSAQSEQLTGVAGDLQEIVERFKLP